MRPTLYISESTPSCTAVALTAKALNLSLEIKAIDEEEAIYNNKLNLHSFPILKDNGYIVWDSHAIIAFLVGKYGKDDELYPKQSHVRAIIDQALLFHSGVVSFFTITKLNSCKCDDNVQKIREIYQIVEEFFRGDNKWVAGNNVTIADLTLIPSITALNLVVEIDAKAFPKLAKWIGDAEQWEFYGPNREALANMKSRLICC